MKYPKKSQVTVFIILGVVILVIFLGIIYLVFSDKKETLEGEVSRTQGIPTDVEPIISFAENCFEQIAKEGLFLLGSQGGYIYTSQGGNKPDYTDDRLGEFFMEYDGKRVPYRINLPGWSGKICDPIPPGYPTKESLYYFPYEKLTISFDPATYFTTKEYYRTDCFGKRVGLGSAESFEGLKYYVQSNIKSCDFGTFFGYTVSKGEPVVQVETTGANTYFDINYPLTVINTNTQTRTDAREFKITVKLSLSDLYDFTNDIMQYDVSDPTFDIGLQSRDGFSVYAERDVVNSDDAIIVRSELLKLDGKPFELVFGRRNRYPALEFVHDTNFDNFTLVDGPINWGDAVNLGLYAVDPDEDDVTIYVKAGTGYKEKDLGTFKINYGEDAATLFGTDTYIATGADAVVPIKVVATDGEYEDYQTKDYNGVDFELKR